MGNNTTMTKCYANVGKNRTWFQRLKGYFLDNADYFATASVMLNGNAASAAQTVSYTHLDVYKRQVWHHRMRME